MLKDIFNELTGRRELEHRIEELERKIKDKDDYINQLHREIKANNNARAEIEDTPQYDYLDPEYKTFDAYLEGKKWFSEELEVKRAINWWIKFRELLQHIGYEHYYAVHENDWIDGVELIMDEFYPHGIVFSIYECSDQTDDKFPRGHHFLPLDFLWTNWQDRCDKIKEEKRAEQEQLRAAQEAADKQRRQEWQEQEYRRAKEIVSKFESQ